MNSTQIALIVFILVFSWIIPMIIKKNKIEDNIKLEKTLPIGSVRFKAFLKLTKWVLIGFAVLWLLISTFDLLGL